MHVVSCDIISACRTNQSHQNWNHYTCYYNFLLLDGDVKIISVENVKTQFDIEELSAAVTNAYNRPIKK